MKKLLLIEDNLEMRENTAEILELAGYEMYTAENGKGGVKIAQEVEPDLIICDIMMPELDGYGVLRILSKNPYTASIPFIFLTAKAEKGDIRKGMNMGADDYLTKPFEEVELLDAIEVRLQKSEAMDKSYENSESGIQKLFDQARSQQALKELSENREIRYFKPKDIIYREGSFPQYLFFVKSGKLKTYKINEDAKELITGLYKEGDFIGYTALLQSQAYLDSAMALEKSEVILVPKEDFFTLIYNNREVSHRFIKMLSDNLKDREEQLLHLAYDTVRKRVADALVKLEDTYKNQQQETFSMAISRENLANIVGTSKECVIRVLSEFKEEKIVSTELSTIFIKDSEKLRKIKY